MSLIKVEILLPLFYNDGTDIEDQVFADTYDLILKRFKEGLTRTDIPLLGDWIDPDSGILYDHEQIAACWVVCKKTKGNIISFRKLKSVLKRRFKQSEILMYYVNVYRF